MKLIRKFVSALLSCSLACAVLGTGMPVHAELTFTTVTRAEQVVDSLDFRGVTVNAIYAPRNQIADYDSNETYCCAALVWRFYREAFGVQLGSLMPGDIPTVATGKGSFTKTTSPVVGDIIAEQWHWALVKEVNGDEITVFEQNFWMEGYKQAVSGRTVKLTDTSETFWHYSEYDAQPAAWYDDMEPADIGDSFLTWLYIQSAIAVLPQSDAVGTMDGQAMLGDMESMLRAIWRLTRSDEGWYRIQNVFTQTYLTAPAVGDVPTMAKWSDTDTQKWYLYVTDDSQGGIAGYDTWIRSAVGDTVLSGGEDGSVRMLAMEDGVDSVQVSKGLTQPGDLNVDDRLTVADAVLMARAITEDTTLTLSAEGSGNLDLTHDHIVNADDMEKLLENITRYYEAFGWE